jgi:cytochrome c biogenesis factor
VGLYVFINPLVGWIWPATGIMALGGLLAVLPPPRRERVFRGEPVTPRVEAGEAPSESR